MATKKHMTVAECQQRYPDVFKNDAGFADTRLDETMKRYMTHMISEGENPYDAKLKTLCIALPPDHFKQVPSLGAFPKMIYHVGGKTAVVQDEEQMEEVMKEKGWGFKPLKVHLDKFQRSTVPRDENIKRLEKELAAEVKARSEESGAAAA